MTIIHDISRETAAVVQCEMTHGTKGIVGIVDGSVVINMILNESQLEELGSEVYALLACVRQRKLELAGN